MKMCAYKDIELQEVEEKDAEGVSVRWVISDKDGAENFFMRIFDVQPGGNTPFHKHAWEHEVFILDGQAEIVTEQGKKTAPAGTVIFVQPEEQHQFRNETTEILRFICLIPKVEL
jgi:quercetin dioxygenase-like cupin family protein